MLLIRGIYLLLLHLPTSHTTVRAVPHTAVPRFDTYACTMLSLVIPWNNTTLAYCRFPTYRLTRKSSSDIWLLTVLTGFRNYYRTAWFGPSQIIS